MKFYINRNKINHPWGGGARFINAFHDHVPTMGHDIVKSGFTGVPDVMLMVGLETDHEGGASLEQAVMYQAIQEKTKLVLRVNENDARKGTNFMDDYLLKMSKHIDGTIFVSSWLRDHFVSKGWACKKNKVIVNGVDSSVFKPTSEKKDNQKINVVMSHWSDNALKGQDFAEWIDAFVAKRSEEFTFTYIGRTRASLKNSTVIGPLCATDLGAELAKYDVCINASRFDPGPNSVIEPIACGLPTYVHVDGGGGVEFAGKDHTFSSFDELETLLLSKQFKKNVNRFEPWEKTIESVVTFLGKV